MPSPVTLTISLEKIVAETEANIRARVFEKWGVNLDDVRVVRAQITDFSIETVTADTELIPGMLWAGYSERLNTLVLRTA